MHASQCHKFERVISGYSRNEKQKYQIHILHIRGTNKVNSEKNTNHTREKEKRVIMCHRWKVYVCAPTAQTETAHFFFLLCEKLLLKEFSLIKAYYYSICVILFDAMMKHIKYTVWPTNLHKYWRLLSKSNCTIEK